MYADSMRQGFEHILNYLENNDITELMKAEEAIKDAKAQVRTRREQMAASKLAGLAASLDWYGYAGLAR